MARIELPAPHPGQLRIMQEARRFNVLRCGRRFGKTTLGEIILTPDAIDGYPVAWFAPTYKYLSEPWRDFCRILEPIIVSANSQERRIVLSTGGVIDFWTLEDEDAGRGRKYKKVVVDEAGFVSNLEGCSTAAIRPTLADLKGGAWFLGTPKGRGYFGGVLYAKGQTDPEWRSWMAGQIDNPHIDPAEVAAQMRDMPEAVARQELLGEPADDEGNPFGISNIDACIAPLSPEEPSFFGVDLAKSIDWCVCIGVNSKGYVCTVDRWQSPWGETKARIVRNIGWKPALIDSTGVGDPIVEELSRERGAVEGFKFTSSSKQQLMEGLAAAIQSRSIRIPEGPIAAELRVFRYEYKPGGRVVYSAPDGFHDDCVCALALAVRKASIMGTISWAVVGSAPVEKPVEDNALEDWYAKRRNAFATGTDLMSRY
jgi:hypothetical protein